MAMDHLSNKLAIILHADVAGSTQMVQRDEHLSHERIQDAFNRFSDIINKYSGNVLEHRGDALLAEFDRPSDAVAATLAFQANHTDFLSFLNDDLKPEIRVGIAMGEVVIADNTVTGAGVVLAQRVEQLADSGGICITSAVQESISKRQPFEIENIGEQTLKGFNDPMRVYKVRLKSGESVPQPQSKYEPRRSQILWKQAAFMVVAILTILGWIVYPGNTNDKPSIAILPFTNLSDDPEQEFFADGMTDDLITDISKIPDLLVIARNSVFAYKGKTVNVRQVAEELAVRYVMEGSVRRVGN